MLKWSVWKGIYSNFINDVFGIDRKIRSSCVVIDIDPILQSLVSNYSSEVNTSAQCGIFRKRSKDRFYRSDNFV